jgi:hypothetical protein
MGSRVLTALVAGAAFAVVPALIGLSSCSSSSSAAVLGGSEGVDTGARPYDGTTGPDDTGTTSADAAAHADTGGLDSGTAGECGAGLTLCGLACVDLTTNPNNCGACSNVCAGAATVIACCASKCVDNTTDPDNCGGCGIVCDAGMSCRSGMCQCCSDAGQD